MLNVNGYVQTYPLLGYHRLSDRIPHPKAATEGSACIDLPFMFADENNPTYTEYNSFNNKLEFVAFRTIDNDKLAVNIAPGHRVLLPTGLIFTFPPNYSLRIYARSSTPLKYGLIIANGVGVIDSDYNQEIFLLMANIGTNVVTIEEGTRLAQAELVYVTPANLLVVNDKPGQVTDRVGGLGSTGV
jgi:dUTP pyrophosphatase